MPTRDDPTLRALFQSPEAHPLTLLVVLTKHFGGEWLNWEPVTIFDEIMDDFRVPLNHINKERILAARLVATTDRFWDEWEVFSHVTDAFNGKVPNFAVMQHDTPGEIFSAIGIAEEIRGLDMSFSEEVAGYVAACFIEAGVTYLPEPVTFAQDEVSKPTYTCLDCGNTDVDDNEDGLCDVCCGRFLGAHPLNFQPEDNRGKNLVKFLRHDPAPVKQRFDELSSKSVEGLEKGIDSNDTVDVQAAKLLAAKMYAAKLEGIHERQTKRLKGWMSKR